MHISNPPKEQRQMMMRKRKEDRYDDRHRVLLKKKGTRGQTHKHAWIKWSYQECLIPFAFFFLNILRLFLFKSPIRVMQKNRKKSSTPSSQLIFFSGLLFVYMRVYYQIVTDPAIQKRKEKRKKPFVTIIHFPDSYTLWRNGEKKIPQKSIKGFAKRMKSTTHSNYKSPLQPANAKWETTGL